MAGSLAPQRDGSRPGSSAGAPAADECRRPGRSPPASASPGVNAGTGLATDYLNHFNEVVMLIDMLPVMPDCAEHVIAWQPASYEEHFRRSRLRHALRIAEGYSGVEARRRVAFESAVADLDSAIAAAQQLVAGGARGEGLAASRRIIGSLLAWASALINGAPVAGAARSHPQATVDALFR